MNIKGDFKVGSAMSPMQSSGGLRRCITGSKRNTDGICCERNGFAQDNDRLNMTVFKEGMVFPLPDDLPLEYGALLEPLAIAVHTIDIAKVKIG